MKAHHFSHSINRRAGFTLLELVGVMAVISILLAAAIPLTINIIQNQRLTDERAALPVLAEALKRGMLREQVFPEDANGVARNLEDSNDAYWWNIASRHGAGSATEARYPLGSGNYEGNVRKLYFADNSFEDFSFADLTGGGTGWLNDFQDPRELRFLLLSTTNPDLPLPDSISTNAFNRFWDEWAVGSDGEPLNGSWNNYGLSASAWETRAAELVVQRVDLRDWLCEVRIENHRAVKAPNGAIFDSNQTPYPSGGSDAYASRSGTDLIDEWDDNTAYVATTNLADAEALVIFAEQSNGNGNNGNNGNNNQTSTVLAALILSDRGQILNDSEAVTLTVGGFKNGSLETTTINLIVTDRAPIALIVPSDPNNPLTLSGWGNGDPRTQTRYFLKGQQLLLGEPWDNAEVGTFDLDENFKSLRFDGQRWRY